MNLRMFSGMLTSLGVPPVQALPGRALRALHSVRGGFDLSSIITGVVTIAILTVGVLAAVFGVIPAAQDHAARQDLASVRTAEGVTKAKDGKYRDGAGLEVSGYLVSSPKTAVGADAPGACWIGFIKSQAGTVFYLTSGMNDPQLYTPGTDAGCLTVSEQEALAETAGATPVIKTGYGSSWGVNDYGMLGNGTTAASSTVPVAVSTAGLLSGKSLTAVSAAEYHSCGIADGAAYCWGRNYAGELGDNKVNITSNVPVAVSTAGVLDGKTVTDISVGVGYSCVVADGKAYCWGENNFGQLGDLTTYQSHVPVAVSTAGALAGKTVTAISAGVYTTCAVADGNAYCWGRGTNGELGNGTLVQSLAPVAVTKTGALAEKPVSAISVGAIYACLIAEGAAYCWGHNSSGMLGDGTNTQSTVPVAVDASGALAGKTVTGLSADRYHTCAVAGGGTYCWGRNLNGQLGNGKITNSLVPVAVKATGVLAGKTVTAVSAGMYFTCAIADAAAYCWGQNTSGQLGDGTKTQSTVPVAVLATGVLAGAKVTAIAAANAHTAAVYR